MTCRGSVFTLQIIFLSFISGCKCSDGQGQGEKVESAEVKMIGRGKAIYVSNCISCHNINPKMSGSLGPDVFGSSKELLKARILEAQYPAGYKPKRESHLMPKLPHLEPEIDALFSYLNSSAN